MPIIACGINHKTAPVALREKAIFQAEKIPLYLQDLMNENIKEVVLLSTCNRSEIYCEAENASQLLDWFCRQHQLGVQEIKSAWYEYCDQAAVEHMMSVACGLDSMILGESQILGQMKDAFSESCAAGSVGPQFNRLFQQIFSVAKAVRTHTSIGACPVSIASAAVNLAKQHLVKPFTDATVLLVGAGDTIQLVLRHLQSHAIKKTIIANRNEEHAGDLAKQFSADVVSFAQLQKNLSRADLVISATGSPIPLVTKSMLQDRNHPLLIIDIAVPRDVEATVGELSSVQLFCIDDLKKMIQVNLSGREHAADKARQVIKQKSQEFMLWLQSLDQVATTIRAYRQQIEDLCRVELAKATQQLEKGSDPIQVLSLFAHALTNKLLHHPSVQLRQAGVEGRLDLLQLAQQLFAIPEMSPR